MRIKVDTPEIALLRAEICAKAGFIPAVHRIVHHSISQKRVDATRGDVRRKKAKEDDEDGCSYVLLLEI